MHTYSILTERDENINAVYFFKKVHVGNDQEKAHSEINSHTPKNEMGKSRGSNYFPVGGHSVTQTLKTYIRFKQHKIRLQK